MYLGAYGMKNIVLIGLSGSGKTTAGCALAEELCRNFVDIDAEIEKSEGISISEIFARNMDFRQIESEMTAKVSERRGVIISTGGGVVLREENMDKLKQNGLVIFLNRSVDLIYKDIDTENRPLLKDKTKLYTLYDERIHLYKKYADIELENNGSLQGILDKLKSIVVNDAKSYKKQFAVIGHPIDHSLSPLIHKTAFNALGFDFEYGRCDVTQQSLTSWFNESGRYLDGFNVTMPLKVDIMSHLNALDNSASLYNSVNTVVKSEQGLKGYSTDAEGFMLAVSGCSFEKVIILGAGGVVNTVAAALKQHTDNLIILNRNVEKAEIVAHKIGASYDELTNPNIIKHANGTSLLVNATPLGMTGCDQNFSDLTFLDAFKDCLVYDMIYAPRETSLLREAKKRGLDARNGLSMLVYQALVGDSLYLDMEFQMQKVYEKLEEVLG